MSEHQWYNTGIVNQGARRAEEKYSIYRCAGCEQEVWHYYDIVMSPSGAIETEGIPPVCRPGHTQLVTHRQVELFIKRERAEQAGVPRSRVGQFVASRMPI